MDLIRKSSRFRFEFGFVEVAGLARKRFANKTRRSWRNIQSLNFLRKKELCQGKKEHQCCRRCVVAGPFKVPAPVTSNLIDGPVVDPLAE